MAENLRLHPDICNLPLFFSQVREDPLIDLRVIETLASQKVKVLMIASGGDTLSYLSTIPKISSIDAVDANKSQLALARLKYNLLSYPEAIRLKVLGYEEISAESRDRLLNELATKIQIDINELGPKDLILQGGPDFAGRYEQLFKGIQLEINEDFSNLEEVFCKYFDLQLLIDLFGSEATQNPVQAFSRHFTSQTKKYLLSDSSLKTPFIAQMLTGKFYTDKYEWLNLPVQESLPPVEFHNSLMLDFLRNARKESYDFIHLSNILDWLSESEAREVLSLTENALAYRGKVIIRQLNSTLNITQLANGISWDNGLGQKLCESDKSFFYRKIHVGKRDYD